MKQVIVPTLLSLLLCTSFSSISLADTTTDIHEVITPDGTDTYNLVDVIGAMGKGARFDDQTKEFIAEFPQKTIKIPLMPTDKVYINDQLIQLNKPVITNFVGQQAVIFAPEELFDKANLTITNTKKIDFHAQEQAKAQAQQNTPQQGISIGSASNPVVVINGKPFSLDVSPVIIDGHTLVPLRAIFEVLGGTVDWNNEDRSITGKIDNNQIGMTVNDSNATVNGQSITLDAPSTIINGKTFVPLRFIGESAGAKVEWDQQNYRITITQR